MLNRARQPSAGSILAPFLQDDEILPDEISGHFERIGSGPLKETARYYAWRLTMRRKGLQHIPTDLKVGRDAAHMLLSWEMLYKKWTPKRYPGRLSLFCCEENKNLDRAWATLVHDLELFRIEGDHNTTILQPHVVSTARAVSSCLGKALEDFTHPR